MKTLATAVALSVAALTTFIAVTACLTGDPEPDVSTSEAIALDPAMLVGTYHFVYTDSRRTAVEASLKSEAKTPEALSDAIAAAEKEAAASEIEFANDGTFHSRVYGREILASPYSAKGASRSTLLVTMKNAKGEEKTTSIRFQDADTIVVSDPKKGELTFRRASTKG